MLLNKHINYSVIQNNKLNRNLGVCKASNKNYIRIQYVSDIHLEKNEIPILHHNGDYLVLAGDIGNPFDDIYCEFIEEQSKKYEKVFLIAGNHEYFSHNINATNLHINMMTNSFQKKNIHFLNNSVYDITDNLRIIGSTLWSNMSHLTSLYISDFIHITSKPGVYLTIKEYRNMHKISKDFIKQQIDMAKNDNKQLIVITHHAPHISMLGDIHKDSFNRTAYATDLSDLFIEPIIGWISGHTHQSIKTYVNGIPCVSNCYGTSEDEKINFNPSASISFKYEV